MSLKDDLIAAKALIDTPRKWASHGSERYGHSNKLCAVDAISSGRGSVPIETMRQALIAQIPRKGFGQLATYNDDEFTTHADIMDLFDRAINAASIASLDAAIAECAKPLPRHA